jgi:hypothetical protein
VFQDGNTTIGTGTLSSGIASVSTSSLATAGAHSIMASYSGDTNFAGSTSSVWTQVIMAQGGAASQTTLVASPGPIYFRQQASFSVSVSSSGTPSGSVLLLDGDTPIGPALLLDSGSATTQSLLAAGAHTIRAVYQGTADFSGSCSNSEIVNASPRPRPKP